jgi:hypothetical protein
VVTSYQLRGIDADNCRLAINYASQQGHPLNLCITLAWSFFAGTLSDDKRLARAQERLRHSLNRRGNTLYWWWVRELTQSGYPHTHVCAHDPFNDQGQTFEALLRLAFKPDGLPSHDGIDVKPVDPALGGAVGWWRYAFKGLDPQAARERGIKHKPQGKITGKRSGMTQNLNKASRRPATEIGLKPLKPAKSGRGQ